MLVEPAGDGWRVRTDCAAGCGLTVVCIPAAIGTHYCAGCGRRRYGLPAVPVRTDVGVRGRSNPGRLDPDRLTRWARDGVAPAAKLPVRGLVEEWSGRPEVPAATAFVEMLRATVRGGAMVRCAHTVALSPGGRLIECVGVHWCDGAAFWTRHDVPGRPARPRKVDLRRTPGGRRKVLRFDPIPATAPTVRWSGEVLLRADGRPVVVSVKETIRLLEERYART